MSTQPLQELSRREAALTASQQQLDSDRVSLQQQATELQREQQARSSAFEQLDATKARLDVRKIGFKRA